MIKLKVNKDQFCNQILTPASKLADNLCLEFGSSSETQYAKTMVASSDNSAILLASIPCEVNELTRCIIPDSKTFLRLFSGISDSLINLDIESNVISYKGNGLSFKYHLLDEAYLISKKSLSEEKLNSLTFDTEFNLTKRILGDIIKFNSIIPDAEKLYFFQKDQEIWAKIGDEQKANTNEMTICVSKVYDGCDLTDLYPLNIQNMLLMSIPSDEIRVKINHNLKVFRFDVGHISYIVSGLVK